MRYDRYSVRETLLWYDGPILTRGTLSNGEFILAMSVEDDLMVAVELFPEIMDAVVNSSVTLREAFTTHRVGRAWRCPPAGDGGTVEIETMEGEIPEEWLSDEGCYLLK